MTCVGERPTCSASAMMSSAHAALACRTQRKLGKTQWEKISPLVTNCYARCKKACGRKKGDKRGTPYCRPTKKVSSKTPKTSKEMTAAEKKSRIAQKKRLGQPAGKPRRVESLRRKKTVKKKK